VGKDRQTRTARYLTGVSPKLGYDGVKYVGTTHGEGQSWRLGWEIEPQKSPYDFSELCRTIEIAEDVQFVCDTSVVHDQVDPKFFSALLNRPAKTMLTPRVAMELEPWLARRRQHAIAKAMDSGHEAIAPLGVEEWGDAQRNAYVHYVNLLSYRKKLYSLVEYQFERDHGRPPGPQDEDEVRAKLQRDYGDRAYLLAKKGRAGSGKTPTYYTDEEVVYAAVASALRSGRETVILTRDEDLLDQFYRLMYLIDSHYRSMLIADVYLENLGSLRTHPMPSGRDFSDVFSGRNDVLVERSMDLPNDVLPKTFAPVPIHCWLIGPLFTSMTFVAETQMLRLLEVKGRTGGLNTDRLGNRNCHLLVPSLTIPQRYGHVFAIAQDQTWTLPKSGWSIPKIEVKQAILPIERFTRVETSPLA
jgi:hypothetical protein